MIGTDSTLSDAAIVLVVEDEPLQRLAALDLVESAGFRALAAADATEAISILEARDDIRLVFTDFAMPRGIDGMKLAAMIRERWPPIKVIIVSGYLDDPTAGFPDETIFFHKPYREDQIVEQIRHMLA